MKLEVNNLKKSFGETEVLHGVSFSVESGSALGLLGRNGAGKYGRSENGRVCYYS